ncbi:MAG: hypothetical protein HOV80_11050 [Polyangiaceae bacterium]|nr:hypothetical protein [Polyangiaceae bacterium]
MKHGIAPRALAAQVENTASWSLHLSTPVGTSIAAHTIRDAKRIEEVWRERPRDPDYLRLLLSAHFLTVGTFCPTDVDARIRHHIWAEMEDPEELARAIDIVDEIAALDPRWVSARVLTDGPADAPRDKTFSGHDGEWFSVRAGALGRALALGAPAADVAARLEAAIEDELAREAAMFEARLARGEMIETLRASTILAHNVGDLSRVVEAWPKSQAGYAGVIEAQRRYARLGHEPDRSRFNGAFYVAGAINKSVMAIENHRFLALREARVLRRARDLLLPIGPFFYDWGKDVARALETEKERGEVLGALVETHLSRKEQQGVLRGIAGLAEGNVGSWDDVIACVPARLRKIATTGDVQAAIKTPERAFLGRLENRYRAAVKEATSAR